MVRTRRMDRKWSSRGSVLCAEGCWGLIDLDWFARERQAGRLPIVHECGRVLYRG